MGRLILVMWLASLAAVASGQESPLHKKVNVNYQQQPVVAVLNDLGERAGVRFDLAEAGDLLNDYGPVTYAAKDQEAGRIATAIVRPRHFRLEPAAGGVVQLVRLDPMDEFKAKREESFEFAEKPKITLQGDKATITFETKAFCDATVAVEDAGGRIVRHLASGVLGDNAPEPFQWNSKKQMLVWDGKNDQGDYIDDKSSVTIRVSLGLKPEYERAFLQSPYRRAGGNTPVFCPAPEGVYVFDGSGFDHLRLFDHEGKYVRTIYPFPADKVDAVKGLTRQVMPQSGQKLPLKQGFYESTLLTSGYSGIASSASLPSSGAATFAMAMHDGQLFMPCLRLNRIATDGTSGGMDLEGPKTSFTLDKKIRGLADHNQDEIYPRSAAVSPDGKTLYFTGFGWDHGQDGGGFEWIHGVAQMNTQGNDPPRPFVGPAFNQGKEISGTDNAHFRQPVSVACDAQGHVYVADYANDRIQVFNADATFVKSIPVSRPTDVCVHQKTGDIYVFSWLCAGAWTPDKSTPAKAGLDMSKLHVPAVMRHLGPLSNPQEISSYPLPLPKYVDTGNFYNRFGGIAYRAALDSYTEPPTVWIVPGVPAMETGYSVKLSWRQAGILVLTEKDGKLELKRDFGQEAAAALPHLEPPISQRQRLHVNPKTGELYVAEGDDVFEGKSFHELIKIDPATGHQQLVQIPFHAEDLAFDLDGLIYLRTLKEIVRYDPTTWREVPFDYGEERRHVGYGFSSTTHYAPVLSAIAFDTTTVWHQGGISVSPRGDIAAAFYYQQIMDDKVTGQPTISAAAPYTPKLYPGRGGRAIVHVWDKHGQLLAADAIPGLGVLDGLAIDRNNDLYVLAATTRVFDGKPYFDYMTGTAMKFRLGQAKMITSASDVPVPLSRETAPTRPPELDNGLVGPAWTQGAQWYYGGAGFCGKNGRIGHACACWNARLCLDYFARSFVPEIQHCSVAVLDANGNLILRIGRYGNEDSAGKDSAVPLGGDEVGLFYPAYVGVHTDRRLFIADPGNARIASVRLGYHTTGRVDLKDIKEGAIPSHAANARSD